MPVPSAKSSGRRAQPPRLTPNGDGYGDLVTGVPYDASLTSGDTPAHRGGEIQVLYGSAQGITTGQKPRVIHQDTASVPGGGEDGDLFGLSLSVGDTNG